MIKETEPLISVIVAAYNVEHYLPRFFNSLTNQSYKKLDIIIVDDGSIDETGKLLDEFTSKHDNVRVFHTANNGPSIARNIGIDKAVGDYISFLDADDEFSLDLYMKVVDFIKETACDLIIFDRYDVRSDGTKLRVKHFDKTGLLDKQNVMQKLFDESLGSQVWEKVYKKNLWDGVRFIPGRVFAEDVAVLYKVFDKAEKIGAISEPLYYYHINEGSLTTSYRSFKWVSFYLALKERLEFAQTKYPNLCGKLEAKTLNIARWALDNYILRHELCDKPYMPEIIQRIRSYKGGGGRLDELNLEWYNKLLIKYFLYFPKLYAHTIKYIHKIYYYYKPSNFNTASN